MLNAINDMLQNSKSDKTTFLPFDLFELGFIRLMRLRQLF